MRWEIGSFGAGVAETGCHMMTMLRGAISCEMATASKPSKGPHGRGSWSGQATGIARAPLMRMRSPDTRGAPRSRRRSPLHSLRNGAREALLARRRRECKRTGDFFAATARGDGRDETDMFGARSIGAFAVGMCLARALPGCLAPRPSQGAPDRHGKHKFLGRARSGQDCGRGRAGMRAEGISKPFQPPRAHIVQCGMVLAGCAKFAIEEGPGSLRMLSALIFLRRWRN